MANICKQMMFNLEIQTADKPRKHAAIRREICCRTHLVYRPTIFNGPFLIRNRKIAIGHNVCTLKNKCKHKPKGIMHNYKPQNYQPPGYRSEDEWNGKNINKIKNL